MRSPLRAAVLPVGTALLSVALLAGSVLVPPSATARTTREARLLAAINQSRVDHGLRPLHARAGLMRYAREHSQAMAARGTLFHTSNFSVVCCWSMIGENIAQDFSVPHAHRMLMHSPGHRANLLDRRFRGVGVGVVQRHGRIWVTEVFRRHS